MREKLESLLVFTTGFAASIVSITYYRHQTVFAELCERMAEEQLPGPSAGIGSECLGFEQVLAVTAINPLYFLISVVAGVAVVALFWKIKQ